MKFSAYYIYSFWSTIVYDPVAHWVWGAGGWLKEMGTLVLQEVSLHLISGILPSAVLPFMIGKRKKGHPPGDMYPHNLPMTVLGAGLLWFGWSGSDRRKARCLHGGSSAMAFVATHPAVSATVIGCSSSGTPGRLPSSALQQALLQGLQR